MKQSPFLAIWFVTLTSLTVVHSSWAQEEDRETTVDPCAELLAIDPSESSDDGTSSEQLELSIARLDDCLNTLLLGLGGTEGVGIDGSQGGVESPFSTLPQDGGNPNLGQDSESLSNSLTELDDFLDGVDIQLDALNASSSPSAGGQPNLDSLSENSELNAEENVSGELQEDIQGDGALEGEEFDNESRHTKKNRQPADPKDEDAVLKQIREAAERETDPDTKEALWDQYYDYMDSK